MAVDSRPKHHNPLFFEWHSQHARTVMAARVTWSRRTADAQANDALIVAALVDGLRQAGVVLLVAELAEQSTQALRLLLLNLSNQHSFAPLAFGNGIRQHSKPPHTELSNGVLSSKRQRGHPSERSRSRLLLATLATLATLVALIALLLLL